MEDSRRTLKAEEEAWVGRALTGVSAPPPFSAVSDPLPPPSAFSAYRPWFPSCLRMASPLPLRLAGKPGTVADVVHGPIASPMRTFMDSIRFSRPRHHRSGSPRHTLAWLDHPGFRWRGDASGTQVGAL